MEIIVNYKYVKLIRLALFYIFLNKSHEKTSNQLIALAVLCIQSLIYFILPYFFIQENNKVLKSHYHEHTHCGLF